MHHNRVTEFSKSVNGSVDRDFLNGILRSGNRYQRKLAGVRLGELNKIHPVEMRKSAEKKENVALELAAAELRRKRSLAAMKAAETRRRNKVAQQATA